MPPFLTSEAPSSPPTPGWSLSYVAVDTLAVPLLTRTDCCQYNDRFFVLQSEAQLPHIRLFSRTVADPVTTPT